jgi:glycosyltransferase involved in cell wall biosynthesis
VIVPECRNWEVLVVDNNSNDETLEVCRKYTSTLPLRYVFEPKQGLSASRNRGLKECFGNLLLFTDDDMNVSKDWIGAYINACERFKDAEYFGGKIIPEWNKRKPRWVKNEGLPLLSGLFGTYDLGSGTREYVEGDPLPFGGNFAMKRTLFERLGLFRTDLGIKGTQIRRGEETEYLARGMRAGAKGVYVGGAICHHRLQRNKLNVTHIYEHGKQKGISDVISGQNKNSGSYIQAMNYIGRGLFQLAIGRGELFRQCLINAGMEVGVRNCQRR